MNHGKHMYLMLGAVAIAAVLYFTGAVGASALLFLWPLACLGMMAAMMWGTGGMHRRGDAPVDQDRVGRDTRPQTHH